MDFLRFLKIGDSWVTTAVVFVLVGVAAYYFIRYYLTITRFINEVKAELRKANWPWESDPKIKGFKKYKELIDSTIVVLVAVILLAGFVQFWDFVHVQVVTFFTRLGA